MSEFQTVARVGDIPEGEGCSFQIAGRLVAVFYVDGRYYAIDDVCSHMGASLASGYVEDGAVYCPWHGWKFCIKQGTWLDNPQASVGQECFDVRLEGDQIQVRFRVPEKDARSTADCENDRTSDPDETS